MNAHTTFTPDTVADSFERSITVPGGSAWAKVLRTVDGQFSGVTHDTADGSRFRYGPFPTFDQARDECVAWLDRAAKFYGVEAR